MSNTPPGHLGLEPLWTSSAKSGVGTAVNAESRVWFTLSHGIVAEVYYPFIDRATIHIADLPTAPAGSGAVVQVTLHWPGAADGREATPDLKISSPRPLRLTYGIQTSCGGVGL